MTIQRKLLIGLLALGTVGGYAGGIASLSHCATHHRDRRDAFEAHVADVCTRAAHRVIRDERGERRDERGEHHHP